MINQPQFDPNLKSELTTEELNSIIAYTYAFDRTLLYSLAVNFIPPDFIKKILENWYEESKRQINLEASTRTELLEGTVEGILLKTQVIDGEQLRLNRLKALNKASKFIQTNFGHNLSGGDAGENENSPN